MSSLAKKSFRVLLGRGSVSVFSILLTIYFAYTFAKPIFAFIALYETAVSLAKVFCDLGLHFRVIRETPPLINAGREREAYAKIVLPSAAMRFGVGVIVCILFYVLALLASPWLRPQLEDLDLNFIAIVCAVHMLLTLVEAILIPIFAIQQRFGMDAFLESAAALLENVFALICYVLWGQDHYFTGIALGIAIIVLVRFVMIRRVLGFWNTSDFSMKEMGRVLREYFPFYLRKFFRIGFVQGEQLLIPILLPLGQLANFKLAKKCSGFLKNYVQAFSDPLMIKLSKSRNLGNRKEFVKTFLVFTVPVPLVLALFSPWIMKIVGGAKYAESWYILAILYVSYVFYALSQLQMTVISIFGKPTEFLARDAAGGVVGLLSTFGMILLFQEYGIAWGQLISYLVLYVVGYRISQRYIDAAQPVTIESESSKS